VRRSRSSLRVPCRTAGFVAAGLCLTAVLLFALPHASDAFSPERVGFSIRFKDTVTDHSVIGAFVLPGESLEIEIVDSGDGAYAFDAPDGRTSRGTASSWTWTAPSDTGLYPLTITGSPSGDTVTVNVFVMVPAGEVESEHLNGYRIGTYPSRPYKGMAIYLPPAGFIEVTERTVDTLVSPHFTLGQFLCKQEGGYPKYVVLRERLLIKLEGLIQKLNDRGYLCETLSIMSGYRTPYYNRAIGNVTYSQHVYGGAADVFIDERPCDGVMDDLNGDGIINRDDAAMVCDVVDGLCGESWYDDEYAGGLGSYEQNSAHGPFLHIDVRGFRARW